MHNKSFLLVANWKMYFSHAQAITWIDHNKKILVKALAKKNHTLTICPSFDALSAIKKHFTDSPILLGAQDCSPFESGAYTGQVQAQSLKEIGCTYCIIGHSETRMHLNVSNSMVQKKIEQAIKHNLIPVIAIGEDLTTYQEKKTIPLLTQQLDPIIEILKQLNYKNIVCIAYEPLWAIGTGINASPEVINSVFQFIQTYLTKHRASFTHLLLYGGSVNINNTIEIKQVDSLAGFLIGSASTDINQLKDIIELL